MPDWRDFLPPPPWEQPSRTSRSHSNPVSEDEFYQHVVEKYRIHVPEAVFRLTEPLSTTAVALAIASYMVIHPQSRARGLGMYQAAEEDATALVTTGILDPVIGEHVRGHLETIRKLLGRLDFPAASELMNDLSVELGLVKSYWIAKEAKKW